MANGQRWVVLTRINEASQFIGVWESPVTFGRSINNPTLSTVEGVCLGYGLRPNHGAETTGVFQPGLPSQSVCHGSITIADKTRACGAVPRQMRTIEVAVIYTKAGLNHW